MKKNAWDVAKECHEVLKGIALELIVANIYKLNEETKVSKFADSLQITGKYVKRVVALIGKTYEVTKPSEVKSVLHWVCCSLTTAEIQEALGKGYRVRDGWYNNGDQTIRPNSKKRRVA